ncbi:unnamed protein product [Calypogeia fissa]
MAAAAAAALFRSPDINNPFLVASASAVAIPIPEGFVVNRSFSFPSSSCSSSSAAFVGDITKFNPKLCKKGVIPGRLKEITTRRGRAFCALTKDRQAATEEPANLVKEAHKYFDQVVITVRAGDGGHGSVLEMPVAPVPVRSAPGEKNEKQRKNNEKGKRKTGVLKRGSDGTLQVPMGGHGGDVILVADESVDSLLEFHKKRRYNAKRGGNVNASGPLTPKIGDGVPAPTLLISVPIGTVVKRKKGGKLLADLSRVGDKYLVARGGQGGISVLEAPKYNRKPLRNVDPSIITDPDDKVLTLGGTGEEIVLELTLRVVADVGLVGLPNAGKSSLLAAVTRATPDIADYPFTTLMPNLGQLPGSVNTEDGGYSSGATLADLPGLIKGAHLGKGLGRMFLRHLRRTRLLLHVVDTSADDPISDYKTLREELYMYNPDYGRRPHIVVLNKLDLPKAMACFEATRELISSMGTDAEMASLEEEQSSDNILPVLESDEPHNIQGEDDELEDVAASKKEKGVEDFRRPLAVVGISAREGQGMQELLSSIRDALDSDETKAKEKPRRQARPQMYKPPQWQL